MLPAIFEHLQARRGAMLDTLRALVEMETPTDNKFAIDRAQAFLRGEFESLGGAVEMVPQVHAGDHLRAAFYPEAQVPQLTLLTHVDTVYSLGVLASMPFRAEARLARGPGIFDMKGGIVIAL